MIFQGNYKNHIVAVHTDAPGAVLYAKNYGFQVRKKISKSENQKWHLTDQDRVLKSDSPDSEYVMTAENLSKKIVDRVMTDPSYWSFFDRNPDLRALFEVSQTMSEYERDSRYQKYFEHFRQNP